MVAILGYCIPVVLTNHELHVATAPGVQPYQYQQPFYQEEYSDSVHCSSVPK